MSCSSLFILRCSRKMNSELQLIVHLAMPYDETMRCSAKFPFRRKRGMSWQVWPCHHPFDAMQCRVVVMPFDAIACCRHAIRCYVSRHSMLRRAVVTPFDDIDTMHTDINTHVAYTSKHTEIQYIFTYIYNMYIYTYKRLYIHT